MNIWFWVALYLVIGFGSTYLIHKNDPEWSSNDKVEIVGSILGFIFVSLTWPIETLIPFLYGLYLGIRIRIKHKRHMKSNNEEGP